MKTDDTEEWRPVVGYGGKYEVSSLGRVRSLDHVVENAASVRAPAFKRQIKGKILAQSRGKYARVSLSNSKTADVHVLVAAAFIGPRPDGHDICHLDGNSRNNKPENITYATHKENESHKDRHGTRLRGESHHWTKKLNKEQVREIRLLAPYDSHELLAAHYGVDRSMISAVVCNKAWRDPAYVPVKRRVVL